MVTPYIKDKDWLTRNMGYDLAIKQLDQRAKYLRKPQDFLNAKSAELTKIKAQVGLKFKTIFEELTDKGVPDAAARQLAINAAQQQGQIDSVLMGLSFPEQLFGDASRSTYGLYGMMYPDTDADAVLVGTPPPIGYVKKYKKKSKKSKKN